MSDRENTGDGGQGGQATIKSLKTTFTIVKSLQALGGGRLTEVASHADISKSTVHKHLATLVEQGYVVKEGDDYRVSFKFLDVGGHARAKFLKTNIIKPKMQELAEKTSETAQFMTEEHGQAVVLYREAGRKSVPSRTRTGKHMYLHQTASGKAILSGLPDERVHEIIDEQGLPRATESTITDRDALVEEIAEIRESDISYSYGESTKGLYAVAVPMFSPEETILGACAVSGPSHRMRGEPMSEELPSIILSIVNEIELNIAHA